MTIQERISSALNQCISNRAPQDIIDNFKFIKAELQRGKNKYVSDDEAVKILVGLIKNQIETIKELQKRNLPISEQTILIKDIKKFLPAQVISQLEMTSQDVKDWIDSNVDFSKLKNKNQAIGIIKKSLPYLDGNLVKEVLNLY